MALEGKLWRTLRTLLLSPGKLTMEFMRGRRQRYVKPLALYIYSPDEANVARVLNETSSGGVTVNGVFSHYLENNLPFGGVNNSGIGSSHGIYGFKAFSHERAVLKGGWLPSIRMFFPPYTAGRTKLLNFLVKWVSR